MGLNDKIMSWNLNFMIIFSKGGESLQSQIPVVLK